MKPIVKFKYTPEFTVYVDSNGNELEYARVFAIKHPRLGTCVVNTSKVEYKYDDGSFETLNTVYVPYTEDT